MDATQILNELLSVEANAILQSLPKVIRPLSSSSKKGRKEKAAIAGNDVNTFTAIRTSSSQATLSHTHQLYPQQIAMGNLAAGVHTTSTKPSILLARDLYAEKLRAMHLTRELASSRIALRRSQQKERDLKLSAVRKRSQHTKSVWSLIDQASRQTLRNPPLALSNSVPNLTLERDPLTLLRRAKNMIENDNQRIDEKKSSEDLFNMYVPHRKGVDRRATTTGRRKKRKGSKQQRQRRRASLTTELPLQTNVILKSPSSMALRRQQMFQEMMIPKASRKVTLWEQGISTEIRPMIPAALPTYEDLISRRPLENDIDDIDQEEIEDRRSNNTVRVVARPRQMAHGVRESKPFAHGYPGSHTKSTWKKKDANMNEKEILRSSSSSFLSTVGELQTIEEPSGNKEESNNEHDEEPEGADSTISIRSNTNIDSGDALAQMDYFDDMDEIDESVTTTRRRKRWRQPILQDPYEQFATEVKDAGRRRRRLLQEILGSMEVEINVIEMKQKKKNRRSNSNKDDAILSQVFSIVPSTLIILSRNNLVRIMSEWRLGSALDVENCVNRLCNRVPVHHGQPMVEGRTLLFAMRKMVGSTHMMNAIDVWKLKKSLKVLPELMARTAPLLPGSKLDRRIDYTPPDHARPERTSKSKRRWDNDAFDATSMFIVPILDRPS